MPEALTRFVVSICGVAIALLAAFSARAEPPRPPDPMALQLLLQALDYRPIAREILEFARAETALSDPPTQAWLGLQALADTASREEAMVLIDSILKNMHAAIDAKEPLPPAMLKALARRCLFEISQPPKKGDARAIFDYQVNRILVRRLLITLKTLLQNGTVRMVMVEEIAKAVYNRTDTDFETVYLPFLGQYVATRILPAAQELLYIATGCGNGQKDIRSKEYLQRKHPQLTVSLYCLDPYRSPEGHAYTRHGGILDPEPLKPNETVVARAIRRLGRRPKAMPVVGHLSFHHLGLSLPAFREYARPAPQLLFETYVSDALMESVEQRASKIGIDILANLGFDALDHTRWVLDALEHPQRDDFKVFYLSEQILKLQVGAAKVIYLTHSHKLILLSPRQS